VSDERKPYVCVDLAEPREGVHVVDALPDHEAPCPSCGQDELGRGFGLAGGGFGVYVFCNGCYAMWKIMEPVDAG